MIHYRGDIPWSELSNEIKWDYIKKLRNSYLADCDWTQLADAALNIEEKAAWQEYRQSLRDVPQVFASPDDVVWPVVPGVQP